MKKQATGSFRSSFINSVIDSFDSAQIIVEGSEEKMAYNRKNYMGTLLEEKNQTEKQLRKRNIEVICRNIEQLRDSELELLTKRNEHELHNPHKDILETLDILKDVITKDELQLYADNHKDSEFVQRKIKAIAEEKNMDIRIYPGTDKKMDSIKEIADAYINFIKYENWGMEPAVYRSMTLREHDDILEPMAGGAE